MTRRGERALEIWRSKGDNSSVTGETDFERGRDLLTEDQAFAALPYLQRAYQEDPEDAAVRSYYGLATALERGQLRTSVELCRSAIESAPGWPVFYLNLSRVYLKAGQPADAIETIRSGLGWHPADNGLTAELERLGVRHPPVFASLPRKHLLNKCLGLLAARLHLR